MDIVLRAGLAFIFVFFLTRVLGKRELNSLEPFDVIMLVMLGDLVQQGVTQNDFSVTGLMLAAGTVGILTLAFSFASYRFPRLRPVLEGEPLILVEDGKPIERNIHRERLTLEELSAEARKQQISSLDDVQWAVLETGGTISFIPKSGS
jgi:uncharacterized membrane protein YcaP (DUF421 family)